MEASIYHTIPEELRGLPQWVTHKAKIPYTPATGEKAKSGQPGTWATFDAALAALQSGEYDGLGFQFHDNGIVGVDLDRAIDDSGEVRGWAQEIVDDLDSYTEYSVSGKGLHIFVYGDIPADGRKKKLSDTGEAIEVYKARRYFAMTGKAFRAIPIAHRPAELAAIYERYFPAHKPKQIAPEPTPLPSGKDYLSIGLERDAKFRALWDGMRPGADESGNDMALMNKLAYWCDNDMDAMIDAFRRSPFAAGKDEKHLRKLERGDYLPRTAKEAIIKCSATAADHDKDYRAERTAPKNSGASVKPFDYTDGGNAKVYRRIYAQKAVYVNSIGWLVWNGKRWCADDLDAFALAVVQTEKMLHEALQAVSIAKESSDKDEQKAANAYLRHALTSRNQPHFDRLLEIARSQMKLSADRLDAAPHILNTPAGMVDLKTGNIRPHIPGGLCTKITACSPGTEGAEEWERFLKTITCGDDKLIWFLQQIAGMAAVGRVYAENLVIAYGAGNNGKSTFFNALRMVLGSYAGSISPEVLTTGKQNKGADYAELKGKRLVIAAELDEGTRLSTRALKQLASTDNLTAERKYKPPEDFTPTHSLILFTNHLPRVGSTDGGTWRRIVVCPFKANIPAGEEVKNYGEYLYTHCGGAILSWMIAGAVEFCRTGHRLHLPEVIHEAIEEYQDNNNWMQDFFDECCELGETRIARAGELYTAFREWAQKSGEYIRNRKDFNAELEKQGLISRKHENGVFWYGITLIRQENYALPYRD